LELDILPYPESWRSPCWVGARTDDEEDRNWLEINSDRPTLNQLLLSTSQSNPLTC